MAVKFAGRGGGASKSKGLTATAADIAWGKTALVDGKVVVGTFTTRLGDMAVGSIVKSEVGGVLRNFIVVHQGRPSTIYSSTFDGATILILEDGYNSHEWHSQRTNDYAASDIHAYLNEDFLSLCSAVIKNNVKQVKIPYRPGGGTGTTINSGENGLISKIWLPSGFEVGFTTAESAYFPPDGAKFDYFLSGNITAAKNKRRSYCNGSYILWWLRSPFCNPSSVGSFVWSVSDKGDCGYYYCGSNYNPRPALALPGTMRVLPDGTLAE